MSKKPQTEDDVADLQIGPTDQGMVRLIITQGKNVLNMDFDPEEAMEIAQEILAAAERANAIS